ncbi:hypothetical protein [Paenibacillus rigui]|uniref:hypothetical protein n=1 Tax=Paenibacillus rigui TaxID=554312 RepID=UPI0015C5A669|nr:hypothetical protein [Paenibacillus rigui]
MHRSSFMSRAGTGMLYGLVSGVGLALFLKAVQAMTGSRVYTLLLNVDFVPWNELMGRPVLPLPEWFEFSLHLIVSFIIGVVFVEGLRIEAAWKVTWSARSFAWTWGALLGLIPIPLYVPLSLLSERTPRLDDGEAWCWWAAGHLLYGLLLGCFARLKDWMKRGMPKKTDSLR